MPTAEACARADRPVLRALLFEKDRGVRELPADALPDHAQPTREQLLWVDVQTPDGVPAVLECLGARMDAFEPERAGEIGLVVYDDWRHLFVRALHWRLGDEPIAMPLSLAIGPNVVVTCRRGPLGFIDAVLDNEADHLRVGRLESTVFAMALLDRMLTDYLDGRDAFETLLDRLELKILRRPRSRHLVELQRLRHLASKLRRHLAGQRDLFDAIARPDFDPDQSSDAERACRLISVRYLRVTESMEAARELVNGSFDLYTSRTAESTNQAMHTLTVVTVAMGLAATIAGVLGMNFEVPLFETGERGFLVSLLAIGAIVGVAATWAIVRLMRSNRRPTSSS